MHDYLFDLEMKQSPNLFDALKYSRAHVANHCGQIVIFLSASFFGFSTDIPILAVGRDVKDAVAVLSGRMKLSELTHITYSRKTPGLQIGRFASR